MLDRVSDLMSSPPIARWGIEPLIDEPAHGFFLRLAALNGQVSIRPFAMALGINGRNIKPQEMLSFCEELPIPGLDILRDATPVLGDRGSVYIRGERLRVGCDWSARHRRYCAKCLEESSHHRFWFDIVAISHCPVHGQEMSVEKNGMVWAWGRSAASSSKPAASENGPLREPGLAQYLAGRLGILPRLELSALDTLDLTDAIFLSAVIGDMAHFGWRSDRPEAGRTQATQRAADRGVRFLLADKSLSDLCDEYVRAGPHFINGKLTSKNPRHLLGWLHSPMDNYRRLKSVAQLREYIRGVLVAMDPSIRRKRLRAEPELDRVAINDIAKSLKLRPSEVRQLMLACGDTIANLNADSIARVTSRICSQEAAAEMLGVDARRFAALRKARLFQPLIRGFAGNPAKYDGEAIRSLIKHLSSRSLTVGTQQQNLTLEQYQRVAKCSYANAVRQVLSGEVPISGWDATKHGLAAIFVPRPKVRRTRRTTLDVGHVTAEQAAARLCVQPSVIKNLVRLRVVAGKAKSGKSWAVNVQSLEKFAREFTLAKLFVERLQCPLCKLPTKLQSLGVPIAFSTRQVGVTIIRRSDIARILPGFQDGNDFAASFFSEMRARFLKSKYGHCLRWFEGESEATILGIGGRVRLSMTYQPQKSDTVATLLISSSVSEKMLALADKRFQVLWPESSIGPPSSGRVTVSQRVPLDGPTPSHERTFDWLESCALSLRLLVGHSPRKT